MADFTVKLTITGDGKVAVQAVKQVEDAEKSLGTTAKATGVQMADGFSLGAKGAANLTAEVAQAQSAVAKLVALGGGLHFVKTLASDYLDAADAAGQLEARVWLATRSQLEYEAVMERMQQIAHDSYVSINDIAEVYIRSIGPMRQLGYTTKETLDLTEAMSLALVVSAADAQKRASAIDALSKVMQTGTVHMQEFLTLTTSAPRFVEALEAALGKTRAELLDMVGAGTLTAGELAKVGVELDKLRAQVEKMPTTVGDATTRFRDAFQTWAGAENEAVGSTASLVAIIDALSNNIDGVMTAAIVGAIVVLGQWTKQGIAWAASLVAQERAAQAVAAAAVTDARAKVTEAEATLAAANASRADAHAKMLQAQSGVAAAQASVAFTQAQHAQTAATLQAAAAQKELDAAMAAARGRTLSLTTAINVLMAALIGWQIGTWIREQFEEVRVGMNYIVGATAEVWTRVKQGTLIAWEAIKLVVKGATNWIREQLAYVYSAYAEIIEYMPGGGPAVAEQMRAIAEAVKPTTSAMDEYKEAVKRINAEAAKQSAQSWATIGELNAYESAVERAKSAAEEYARTGQVSTATLNAAFAELAKSIDGEMDKLKQEHFLIGKGSEGKYEYAKSLFVAKAAMMEEGATREAYIQRINATFDPLIAQARANDALKDSLTRSKKATDDNAKTGRDYIADLEKQIATYGQTGAASERYKLSLMSLSPALRKQALDLLDVLDALEETARADKEIAEGMKALAGVQKTLDDGLADLQDRTAGMDAVQMAYNKTVRDAAAAYLLAGSAANPEAVKAYAKALADAARLAAATRADNLLAGNASLTGQIKQQRDSLAGLTSAQIAYNAAVRAANAEAGPAAQRDAATNAALEERLKLLAELRDNATLEDALGQFGDVDPFERLTESIKVMEGALAKAAAAGVKDVSRLERALGNARQAALVYATDVLGQGITSLKSMATEGTRTYAALEAAQVGLNLAVAIGAIVNQGLGDPYTAFARIAAMAALMAQFVDGIRGVASAGFSDTAKQRQEVQGTGSVLGDASAKSDSIAKGVEITAQATTTLVALNRGMLNALHAIQSGIGSASGMLARGAADVDFSGMNLAVSSFNFRDPLTQMLLGGSSKLTDQGIVIFGGALSELLNSVAVGAYQEVQSRSWLFGSTHTNTGIKDVSDEFGRQFALIIQSITDTVRAGATALGLLPADIEDALAAYRVEEIKISLKGLSAEDQQKELQAVFSKLFDDLAGSIVPFIAQFQTVGEGLGETLVRVATEVQVVQEGARQLGLAIDTTDPERVAQIADALIDVAGGIESFIGGMQAFVSKFATDEYQFTVASTALASALDQVGLAVPSTRDEMWSLMQSLDASTEAGRAQIATLLRLADVADSYYSALDAQAKRLADDAAYLDGLGLGAAGSLSAFGRELVDIVASGHRAEDAANAIAIAQGRQGASAAQLARISQWTADQIAAAVRRLQTRVTDALAELYGSTPASLDAINARISDLEQSLGGVSSGIDSVTDAGTNLFEEWKRGIQSLSDYLNESLFGGDSPLSGEEQIAEAQRQLDAAILAARGGDASALAQLPQLMRQFTELWRGGTASGDDFNSVILAYREQLQQLLSLAGPAAPSTSAAPAPVELVPSDELRALYAARDAAQAAQEAEHRQTLAQQLASDLADMAALSGVNVLTFIDAQGIALDRLATDLGVDLQNLNAASVAALGNLANTLGVSMTDLIAALGVQLADLSGGLTELTQRVGVDLSALTVESTQTLAALAGSLGLDLADLASAVGVDLGSLADSQSLLNQALAAEIAGLPGDQRDALAPLLGAIANATTEADANSAIASLEDAINAMAPDIRNQLAPYFANVFPARALDQLDYLSDIQSIARQQLGVMDAIRANLAASNVAAGVPSYAVGTGYVPFDQIANIHAGEAVVPAGINAWFRTANWQLPRGSGDDARVIAAVDALRAEVAALRREQAEQARRNDETIVRTGDRSDERRGRQLDEQASRMSRERSSRHG